MKPRLNHCSGCGNQRRPLKWVAMWDYWLCWPCIERKIESAMKELEHV